MQWRRIFLGSTMAMSVLAVAAPCCLAAESHNASKKATGPKVVRDVIWVFGNPEMGKPGEHTVATYAEATPAGRAKLLGASNVILAGHGIPDDDREAEAITQEVAHCPRLLWEIMCDDRHELKSDVRGLKFDYTKRIAQLSRLVEKYPQIEGVLLDDMSTGAMDKGFKPECVRQIRKSLGDKYPAVKIWGVVATMSLNRPDMNEVIKELDVILLCEWHWAKIGEMEKHIAHCERLFPGKPIVLCTYLVDYGGGIPVTPEMLEKQYDMILGLMRAGRVQGNVIVSITNTPAAVQCTADWIKRVGDEPLVEEPVASD